MTSGANGEWVRQGTPHDDDNANWSEEQSEYGTALSPTEWDDYSSEQSVPVAAPRAQIPEGTTTAASPGNPSQRAPEPVPGQEPDSEGEYRSDETGSGTQDAPVGDPDDSGLDPVHIDPVPSDASTQPGSTAFDSDVHPPMATDLYVSQQGEETTRPRPVVSDSSMDAVGAAEPVLFDDTPDRVDQPSTHDLETPGDDYSSAQEAPMDDLDRADARPADSVETDDDGAMDATEYLAVDPVPAPVNTFEDEPSVSDTDPGSPDAAVVASDDTLDQSLHDDDEMEATQAVPVTVVAADAATVGGVPDGLYRGDGAEPTAVIAEDTYPDVDVEEERQQARRDAERQAREQRLGAVATSAENATREDDGPARVTTDKFLPSFSLFVMRLVTASILGLTSWQILGSGVDATANYLAGFPLIPEPRLVAWILGFTLGALALLLVIGLLQRLVGFLLLVVAVATLVFIRWGNFSIFNADTAGFLGDKDLLLAAVGLLLLGMGGGRWGIDGAFRASRAASKAEREG